MITSSSRAQCLLHWDAPDDPLSQQVEPSSAGTATLDKDRQTCAVLANAQNTRGHKGLSHRVGGVRVKIQ